MTSDRKPPISQGLKCDILFDALPNPLTVRLVNSQREAFRYSTFMSTHATMPPMPNVRVEVTDTSSRRIITCTPVVLTERRRSLVLKPGEAADIQVCHRGFGDLPPGTSEVTVFLFSDTDSKQQTPIAVSRSITVKTKPRSEAGSSALAGKLKESLSRLCLAVERAYQEVGLTRDDVNAVLAVQAAPQKLWQPYQEAWPAVLKARTAAVEELAALGADAVPLLLKAKDESLGGASRGDIFVDALEKISKPAVPALLDALSDPDTPVRSRAVTALARIRDPRAVEAVLRLLEEPDQKMVGAAVWALGLLKDQTAVEPLLRVWNKGLFRAEVAGALGFQQDRGAVRPIMAALEGCLAEAQRTGAWNHQERLMHACATALGQLRDREAIAVLKTALQAGPQRTKTGESYLVAEAAAGALRAFGFRIDGDTAKGGYHIVAAPATSQDR